MVRPRLRLVLTCIAPVLTRVATRSARSVLVGGLILFALVAVPSISLAQDFASVEAETVPGVAGEAGSLVASAESTSAISGLSFGLCFDAAILQSATITPCGTCAFDYFEDIVTAEGLGLAVVTSFMASSTLQAGIAHPVAELSYVVAPGTTGLIPVSVCVLTQASPPVAIVVSDPAGAEPPVTPIDGGVDLAGGVNEFIRGDFDGDGSIALIDAILLLTWGFLNGAPPPCLASVDFDGNANIQITLEAINLLSFLFLGAAPPSSPYPNCGSDPSLDCLESGSTCAVTN